MIRRDIVTWLGLGIVLAGAAVLSFHALRDLALTVGIPSSLAWLLPVAIDAGASVSCACWLSRNIPPDASRFAQWMTWALLVGTVVGNAAQLGMHSAGIVPPWWVAVAVGAIPPAVVGGTVHLAVLVGRGGKSAAATSDGLAGVRDDREIGGLQSPEPSREVAAPVKAEPTVTVRPPAVSVPQPSPSGLPIPGGEGVRLRSVPQPVEPLGAGKPARYAEAVAFSIEQDAGAKRLMSEFGLSEHHAKQARSEARAQRGA